LVSSQTLQFERPAPPKAPPSAKGRNVHQQHCCNVARRIDPGNRYWLLAQATLFALTIIKCLGLIRTPAPARRHQNQFIGLRKLVDDLKVDCRSGCASSRQCCRVSRIYAPSQRHGAEHPEKFHVIGAVLDMPPPPPEITSTCGPPPIITG
jgi:hypothetical protein